jgi:hypothetical protein
LSNSEVLERLRTRHANITAAPPSKSALAVVQQTLGALSSPHSRYVCLSEEERERVLIEWQALASHLGVSPKKSSARKPRQAGQLPPEVLAFFGDADCLPHRPMATDNYEQGQQYVPWEKAQNLRSIDLNPPAHIHWIVFDCDHGDTNRWKTAGLPAPSFITVNPVNGHHHVVYRLGIPVCRTAKARLRPLSYLRALKNKLRIALAGDPSFAGGLTKNPLHPEWVTIRQPQIPKYTLKELGAAVDLRVVASATPKGSPRGGWVVDALTQIGVGGRNRALFDAVRLRPMNESIHTYAARCNALFNEPLNLSEVKGIVRSIERYEASRRGFARLGAEFREKQAARGRRGGRPKTSGLSKPWFAAGVSRSTWYRQRKDLLLASTPDTHQKDTCRVGRPVTTKNTCPWSAEGISRATWYRRLKAGELA